MSCCTAAASPSPPARSTCCSPNPAVRSQHAQVIFTPAHDPREWTAHAPEAMDGQFINVQVRQHVWSVAGREEWEQQQHHWKRWYLMARFVALASTHASRLHPSLHTPPPHIAHTAALGQHGDGQPPGLWAVRGHAAPVQAAGMSSRWRRGVRSAQDKQCGAASQHHSKLFAAAEFPLL